MKHLLIIVLLTSSLFSLYLSDTIPKETTQLVNSFECFSKDDKTVVYTYLLALKYRMDHVDDRDALVKSDLDYWRLWHLVSDIEHNCSLYYKFSHILEETITPSKKDKTTLKKLRRVEGSIRTDGSSESSERMRKYDAKLRKKLLQDPPKFKVLPKNKLLNDYDLTSIKQYPKQSIPQNIYDTITKQKLSGTKEDLLFRYAFLKEEMLRNYDNPRKRHKIKQELLYIQECQKYYNTYLTGEFYHNFKRKLANRSSQYNNYYPIKDEFLPKEVEVYCEHNITSTKLSTFIPKTEKAVVIDKRNVKLENLKLFLEQYKGDTKKETYAQQYLNLMKTELEKSSTSTPSLESLQLLRLQNCLVEKDNKEDFKLIMARVKDFRLEGIKEVFYTNIFNSQRWWRMTISMKIDQEGESEELKHFFDCGQTLLSLRPSSMSNTIKTKDKPRFSGSDMRNAIEQKDTILKYYAKVFENTPTPNMDNKKAIKSGIIAKKWIDDRGNITTPFGDNIQINGMAKGGIKLTYTGIPKGDLCTQFIQLNKNDIIHFNNKMYSGIDYIMVNNKKVWLNNYVYKHVERLCSKKANNTISFVRENTMVKHVFRVQTSVNSAYGSVKKINSIDTNKYTPYSSAHTNNNDFFVIIGSEAKLYSVKYQALVRKLPHKLQNSYYSVLSPNGKYLAVGRYGTDIHIFDMAKNKIIKTIKTLRKDVGSSVVAFLPDNKTLITVGKKIHLLNIETTETVGVIEPRFMRSKKSFSSARITSWVVSPDGDTLYIGGNKSTVERWNIKKGWIGPRKIEYIDHIEDKEIQEVGALTFDPIDNNILVIGSRNTKIKFWDITHKKTIKTLIADKNMNCKSIEFSDDNRYMFALGSSIHLWDRENTEPLDIINGDKIIGGMFLPNSSDFVTFAKTVDIWKIVK